MVVWQKLGLGEIGIDNLALATGALLSITAGTLYQKRFLEPCDVRSDSSLMYLVPPMTALLTWLLFGEPITAIAILGMVVTAAGVSLVVRPARQATYAATKYIAELFFYFSIKDYT
jgi:hypothetical protein